MNSPTLVLAALRAVVLICSLSFAAGGAAVAQTGAPAVTADANALTGAQAQQVLDVLQDPAKRAAFVATLQNLVRALPPAALPSQAAPAQTAPAAVPPTPSASAAAAAAPAKAAPAAVAPLSLPPDSLGARVISTVAAGATGLVNEFVVTAKAVLDVPLLWGWLEFQVVDPIARGQMIDLAWKLAVVLIVAVTALSVTRRLLARPLAALAASAAARLPHGEAEGEDSARAEPAVERPSDTAATEVSTPSTVALPSMAVVPVAAQKPDADPGVIQTDPSSPEPANHLHRSNAALIMLRRLPYLLAALFLYMVPIFVFAFVGNLLVSAGLGSVGTARLVIHAILDSTMIGYTVLAVARLLIAPESPSLRLVQVTNETAVFVKFWARWLTSVTLVGLTLVQIAGYMGMYSGASDALLKVVSLVIHVMAAVMVIQARHTVAAKLRAPKNAHGPVAEFRNRLANMWHIIALFYIVAIWVVLALEIQDGLSLLLRFAIVTSLTVTVTRVVAIVLLGGLERAFRSALANGRHPTVQQRARRYYRLCRILTMGVLTAIAGVVLLEALGLDALRWFQAGALGGQVVGAIFSAGITILIGLVVWEATNTGFQQHIAKLERDAQMARSARLRTLLPIMRTTLLVAILVVVGLTVLSDIGVNIAPLLAGAGIVGVAIGFGSQKLVQDLITGVFLLVENTMQVGDWVTAAGLSGSVETLSIRTMRLRAGDGSVHIVPFSSVTTVTNTNRGLGNAAVEVNVAYKEDTDRVADVLKAIASQMRQEAAFKAGMLSELQLWGVDKVDGAMVTVAGQIVCTASDRWAVQREYNRRMKKRFQELGIEIYNPRTSIQLEQVIVPAPAPAPAGPASSDRDPDAKFDHPVAGNAEKFGGRDGIARHHQEEP